MKNDKNIIRRMIYYMNPRRIHPKMVKLWTFFLILNVVFLALPRDVVEGSIFILTPLAGLFVYALVTKDVMSSLLMGTFSMYILWYKTTAVQGFFGDLQVVLADSENIEMYMSFFLSGGIIIALRRSGSTKAFTDFVTSRFGKSEHAVLGAAGLYAGASSIDDYVSTLTSGASFSPLIDAIQKPRLALAYVIRTFSICVSAVLPFGAWGYFIIYQIAAADNVRSRAEAVNIFLHSIPFMFYAVIACVIAFLFAVGIFPKIGTMKKAYAMAKEGKQMGGLEAGEIDEDGEEDDEEDDFDENDPRKQNVSVLNLVLPIASIMIALIATGLDCYMAFGIAAIFTGLLLIFQGIMTVGEYVQCIVDGFLDMMDMVMILMLGYSIQEVMYTMGMEAFVESVCSAVPLVTLLPVLIFIFFSCSEYLYSLNYTLYQIAIPILMAVLPKVGANVPLCLGALISAGLFGANACVISDLGVLSARACRVRVYEQYITSQPYFIISGIIAAAGYLAAGFLFQ